jgi:hypothetical protein
MIKETSLQSNDPRLPSILGRLNGGALLIEESRRLGFTHNGQLRAALRALIGANDFAALMANSVARWQKKRRNAKNASVTAASSSGSE